MLRNLFVDTPRYMPSQLIVDSKAVMGVNIERLWEQPDLLRNWMAEIITWYDEFQFRPHVDCTFPLSQAAAAHHYIHDRKNIGKVLLTPD